MMTALHIEEHDGGFLSIFRHNRLRVEHLFCDEAALKSVTYEHYRGRVGWSSIDRFVKAQRNRVLCPADTDLPSQSGYKRFESTELSRRMCENAAVWLFRSEERKDIRAALIDPDGTCADFCEALTPYVDPLCVVTDAVDLYIEQAQTLLHEKGAAIRVSRSMSCLRGADVIIAPARIETPLPCSPTAVLLSGERPSVIQPAPVIYDYFFELPAKYAAMKPPYLDDMYFASALYAMAGVYALGSEVFTRCGDGCTIHTRRSLSELLKKRLDNR